jgi:hypothetical protein
MRDVPVMVGTDSQSLIDKATYIMKAIRQQVANPHWWRTPHSSALGKPWGYSQMVTYGNSSTTP